MYVLAKGGIEITETHHFFPYQIIKPNRIEGERNYINFGRQRK